MNFIKINRIEFWILLFFLVRLWGITDPPLEMGHHWRQVTGLMVARNFLEIDANIFFPRIDENNGGTGIIGMEFPVLNYLHYLLSVILGYEHWYGRIINLIITSIGIFYFYQLIKNVFNEKWAYYGTLGLLSSTWFVFSRKMMPDTFCISLMLISLYYGHQYVIYNKSKDLLIFFIFSSLGCLSKIPAVIGFTWIIFYWWKYKPSFRTIFLQSISVAISLVAVYWWYFVWNPFLSETYGTWYNLGKSFSQGFNELSTHIPKILENFYFHSFNSYVLLGLTLWGLYQSLQKKEKELIILSIIYTAAFSLYAIKSGYFFYHHNYYMIPFIPLMALWMGVGVSTIPNTKIKIFLLAIGMLESIANQQHDFFIKPQEYQKMELEKILDHFSNRNDLIAVNGNGNPQLIYLAHRKGWNATDEDLKNHEFIQKIQQKSCKWILIEKNEHLSSLDSFKKIFENERFIIYQIY